MLDRVKGAVVWRWREWRRRYLIARAHQKRARLEGTVFVGITGSLGKTTTKDLAVAVLSRKAPTEGNRRGFNHVPQMAEDLVSIEPAVSVKQPVASKLTQATSFRPDSGRSLSGLSHTAPAGVQSRICRLQRRGLRAFASA